MFDTIKEKIKENEHLYQKAKKVNIDNMINKLHNEVYHRNKQEQIEETKEKILLVEIRRIVREELDKGDINMKNLTHKDYNGISIYRLKEKILVLKQLLSECRGFVEDAIEGGLDEDAEIYILDLYKRICSELNIKNKKNMIKGEKR